MRDIHCHILPGVDDGAANLEQSLAMLEAAKRRRCNAESFALRTAVIPTLITTRCGMPTELLRDHADGFPLQMGFEVNHAKAR